MSIRNLSTVPATHSRTGNVKDKNDGQRQEQYVSINPKLVEGGAVSSKYDYKNIYEQVIYIFHTLWLQHWNLFIRVMFDTRWL